MSTIMLVGGFNHLEKYESQWEGLSHIYCKWANLDGEGYFRTYPLVNKEFALENGHRNRGFTHERNGDFLSFVVNVYQRVKNIIHQPLDDFSRLDVT